MKIYVILESRTERMIRGVTLKIQLAETIIKMFSHQDLFIEEYQTLETESLITQRNIENATN